MSIKVKDIYWVAGFLEGEGCFYWYGSAFSISASQVQKWPLTKLQELVGGPIHKRSASLTRKHAINEWKMSGRKAVAVAMTIYCLLSPKRKVQIKRALKVWKRSIGMSDLNRAKTHCPEGHPYNKENTIHSRTGRGWSCRVCKTCLKLRQRRYRDPSYWKNW